MAVRRAAGALFVTVCAALSVLALAACSFSASTANLSDVKMATDPDGKHPTEAFSPDEPFYCVGQLNNAPKDTTLKAVWIAADIKGVKPDTEIKRASAKGGSGGFHFDLTNDGPWPTGDYEVDLYLNGAKKPTKKLAFEVR